MVNRILNTDLPADVRQSYMSLLSEAATRSDVAKAIRDDARNFFEFQERKGRKHLLTVEINLHITHWLFCFRNKMPIVRFDCTFHGRVAEDVKSRPSVVP